VPHDREYPADQQFHRHAMQNRKRLASRNARKLARSRDHVFDAAANVRS
jgi:hypothetical protein